MNSSPPDPFDRALADWQVRPPAAPDFRPLVWQRLRRAAPATWGGYLRAHFAAWAMVATLTLAAAGWAGRTAAEARLEAERERRAIAYLVELDPRVLALTRP